MIQNQKYKNLERSAREDAELEALEAEYRKNNSGEVQEDQDELEPDKSEEKTWESRYANLRSHSQKRENELKRQHEAEISQIKQELEDIKKQSNRLPANKAEAEEWVKDYPDLARVLMTLMEDKANEVRQDIQALRAEREEENLNYAKSVAIRKLLDVHPDFFEINQTAEFVEWAEAQPEKRGPRIGQAIYDALFNNETDADSAIQAVSLYKSDTGHGKAKKAQREKETIREAATSVRRTNSGNPQSENGKPTFSESQIEAMSLREYEKLEDDIDLAKREGRFIYDLSGAAR